MIVNLSHRIIRHPQPEDAGTITVHAAVEGYNSRFTTSTSLREFYEDECRSNENLNYFLIESGVNDDDTTNGIMDLVIYVDEVTSSASSNFSPECALLVWLSLVYDDDHEEAVQVPFEEDHEFEEAVQVPFEEDHEFEEAVQVPFEEDHEFEEAFEVSFEETYDNIPFRSASTLVVESLPRKFYEKTSSTDEKCAICLEKFNNGARVATLPCQHYFDDECVVKWFETSHFCPLCRFELPC